MRSFLAAVTLSTLVAPALAGEATFQAVGLVTSVAGGGVFAGAAPGSFAQLTLVVTTPGTDVIPGQYTNYPIVVSSVSMTIDAVTTGCSGGAPLAGVRDANPVADGIWIGSIALAGTAPMHFEFSECSGSIFGSTDPTQNTGTWPAASFCAYAWTIAGGGTLIEITPLVFTIASNGPGTPFCTGDGLDATLTTACPCANSGAPGHGCANSVVADGALLRATGEVALDDVVLEGSGMPASVACIYLQGDFATDLPFGDGVRCAGGTLLRLRTVVNSGGASAFPDATETITLAQRGGVTIGSGVLRYYQTYYRNAAALFCPPETFNVTNGLLITW